MAVRDVKMNWKPEALSISKDSEVALVPILKKVLDNGMSVEDFYYIVMKTYHLCNLCTNDYCKNTEINTEICRPLWSGYGIEVISE